MLIYNCKAAIIHCNGKRWKPVNHQGNSPEESVPKPAMSEAWTSFRGSRRITPGLPNAGSELVQLPSMCIYTR